MSTAAGPPSQITVKCSCGKSIKVPANLAGKAVKCPGCQQPLRIPAARAASGAGQPATGDTALAGDRTGPNPALVKLLDEAGFTSSRTGKRCPSCKEDIEQDAVLCVHCGYNLETGRAVRGAPAPKPTRRPTGH